MSSCSLCGRTFDSDPIRKARIATPALGVHLNLNSSEFASSRPNSTAHELRIRASNLDLELAVAQAVVNRLLSDRGAVQEELDAITYPVLTLPPEIISQIFSWTLAPGGPKADLTPLEGPLRLGQICRLWRQIALSMPALWNIFHLEIDDESNDFKECYIFRVETFLSRAASLPLSISFRTRYLSHCTGGMLRTLFLYSQSWENISFDASYHALHTLHSINNQVPQLKSLEIVLTTRHESRMHLFSDAPLLRKVRLKNFGATPVLPWSQLTSLHLDEFNTRDFAEIIRETSNLVHLIIGKIHRMPPPLGLRSIIFTRSDLELQTDILSFLQAPQLRELKIPKSILSPIPLANSASLLRLSLHVLTSVVDSAFMEGLTALSCLKIALYGRNTAISFLKRFISRLTGDPDFLPELQSLTLTVSNKDFPVLFDGGTLADMLHARWYSARRSLRHFIFRSRGPLRGLDPKMADLMAEGMQIRLETDPTLESDFTLPEF
ncbi:hypothetical protein B0H13DRAFT_233296 [Mycena leptocephala]|nr:hypothetical protein B0H13DRAFT_233296 [Mycena leptocephala]